jgi:hypothetical protein
MLESFRYAINAKDSKACAAITSSAHAGRSAEGLQVVRHMHDGHAMNPLVTADPSGWDRLICGRSYVEVWFKGWQPGR